MFAYYSKVTSPKQPNYFEDFRYPSEIAEGSIIRYQLQEGFGLIIRDIKMLQPFSMHIYQDDPLFELGFCLQGGISYQSNQLSYHTKNKESNMSFLQEATIHLDQSAGDHIQTVGIYLTNSALQTYFYGIVQDYDSSAKDYFKKGQASFVQKPIDSHIQLLLQQILQCPYSGRTRRFYLESKSLELLTVYLDQYKNEKNRKDTFSWNSYDIKQIGQAREWILHHLDQPITIRLICKTIGMNDFKLKKGFRELLGTTVFQFVREQRLAKAHQLLLSSDMNITEVALAVGYLNPSRFTAVFKARYGITPTQYRSTK
jgi:AraC-like DNA-binding protein